MTTRLIRLAGAALLLPGILGGAASRAGEPQAGAEAVAHTRAGAQAAGHGEAAGHDDTKVDIVGHLANSRHLEIPLLPFLGHVVLPPGLTKVSVWMVIAALVLVGLFLLARPGMGLVPRGFYNLLESLVVFVRDEIAVKNIGHHHAPAFTPYLLTVFFFIFTCNLLGLLPGGVTVTGNINVTAALAAITLVVTQASGIKQYGLARHLHNLLPGGIPVWLVPIMVVVEVMGILAKPFALAVRLFANMTAGHVVILSLLGLIFTFGTAWMGLVSVPFALFIFLLELLVAFLQAYIFTMLTALFIGMSVHVSH